MKNFFKLNKTKSAIKEVNPKICKNMGSSETEKGYSGIYYEIACVAKNLKFSSVFSLLSMGFIDFHYSDENYKKKTYNTIKDSANYDVYYLHDLDGITMAINFDYYEVDNINVWTSDTMAIKKNDIKIGLTHYLIYLFSKNIKISRGNNEDDIFVELINYINGITFGYKTEAIKKWDSDNFDENYQHAMCLMNEIMGKFSDSFDEIVKKSKNKQKYKITFILQLPEEYKIKQYKATIDSDNFSIYDAETMCENFKDFIYDEKKIKQIEYLNSLLKNQEFE
jgi:hypothetical protein